jgi:hypothetical protein
LNKWGKIKPGGSAEDREQVSVSGSAPQEIKANSSQATLLTFWITRHANISSMQDQPVMGFMNQVLRDIFY